MPGEDLYSWSTTAANNDTADTLINWREGMARAAVNDSSRSEMAAIAKFRDLTKGSITTGGTVNAQTFTSGVGYTAVPTGLRVLVKIGPGLTNTDTATLNMDSIGNVSIKNALGADLTAGELVAGSYNEFLYNGTNWILLLRPQLPGSTVIITGSTTIINSGTGSVSFVDLVSGIDSTYEEYRIVFHNVVPTVTAQLQMRFSIDSGATFISTLSYGYTGPGWTSAGGQTWLASPVGGVSSDFFDITGLHTVPSSIGMSGQIHLYNPAGGVQRTSCSWEGQSWNATNGTVFWVAGGRCDDTTSAINGVRLFPNVGSIASGTFRLYGVQK